MKWIRWLLYTSLVVCIIGCTSVVALLYVYSRDLPPLDSLTQYEPRLVSSIYSNTDELIEEYSAEKRIKLEVGSIPVVLKNAFIAAEDAEFYKHRGIDPVAILRAVIKDVISGKKLQGGSTITQQVAKSFLLTPKKTIRRKIREMFLAFRIEKTLSKDQILNLYLNQIFLGQRSYGVAAATRTYFGKNIQEITLPEAAILAGLPQAPSRDNPIKNPKRARARQRYVLRQLLANSFINKDEYQEALKTEIKIKNFKADHQNPAPYFSEYVRRYIVSKYGEKSLYEDGLKIYTTIDLDAQKAAQNAVNTGLREIDKRLGLRPTKEIYETEEEQEEFLAQQTKKLKQSFFDYQVLTPEGELIHPSEKDDFDEMLLEDKKIYKALVRSKNLKKKTLEVQVSEYSAKIPLSGYEWVTQANPEEVYSEKIIRDPLRELKIGEVVYVSHHKISDDEFKFVVEQPPLVQGALLSYDLQTGGVHAMVGGYDFYTTKSHFNRAVQAKRQPGSTFKPFVFAAGLDNGLTPGTIIVDSPIVYKDSGEKDELEKVWKPDNYGSRFYGDTTLRHALAFSRNIPTIKLLQHLKVSTVINYVRKLGIDTELNADLSLALGSSALSLKEMLDSWSIFARNGKKNPVYFIRKIENRAGEIIEEYTHEENESETEQVISEDTSFLITSLLKSVVDYGTGQKVKSLGRPVAGKTGTTNDYKDAWFIGYVPQMITGVWVGFDQDHPIGRNETGSKAAVPIWLNYMKEATKDLEVKEFVPPNSVVRVAIDAETGDLPSPKTKKRVFEYFAEGTAPGELSPNDPTGTLMNKPTIVTGHAGLSSQLNVDVEDEEDADEILRQEF